MKQGMRVAGWALGMVLWGCLGGATGLAATDPALANFQAWAKNYVAAPASVRPGLEAEGLKLATARRPVFQKLIQENPAQALTNAVPEDTQKLLPEAIRSQLEYWISDRASDSLFAATPDGGYSAGWRDLLVRGAVYRGSLYGRRLDQPVFWKTPIFGVALNGWLAVGESPVQILGTNQTGQIQTLISGVACTFTNVQALKNYEAAIGDYDKLMGLQVAHSSTNRPDQGTLTVSIPCDEKSLRIEKSHGYDTVTLSAEDDLPTTPPGHPWLPAHYVDIALPAGAVVTRLEGKVDEVLWKTNWLAYPAQPPVPNDSVQPPGFQKPDEVIYAQTNFYPASITVQGPVSRLHGYSMLPVRLNLVRYIPGRRELYRVRAATLVVEYRLPRAVPLQAGAPTAADREEITALTVNVPPVEADPGWMPLPAELPKGIVGVNQEDGRCNYLIITTPALLPEYQRLAEFRQQYNGFHAQIVTVDWILQHYEGDGPEWGRDTPNRIRACIRDFAEHRGTRYVLLGGDVDQVPPRIKHCHIDWGGWGPWSSSSSRYLPADIFYSGLDYSYLELEMGMSIEVEDLVADVRTGRVPSGTAEEARNYIDKVIACETNPPWGVVHKFLGVGNYTWNSYAGGDRPPDAMTDGLPAFRAENHPTVSDAEMWLRRDVRDRVLAYGWQPRPGQLKFSVDTVSSWDDPAKPAGNFDQTYNNLANDVFYDGWNFVIFSCHGGDTHASLEIDNLDTSFARQTGYALYVYSEACNTGNFASTNQCLGEAFLFNRQHRGSLAYMGFADTSWGTYDDPPADRDSTGGSSGVFMRAFLRSVFARHRTEVGAAFNMHKNLVQRFDDDVYRYHHNCMNLLGDPAVYILGVVPQVELNLLGSATSCEGGDSVNLEFRRYGDSDQPLVVRYAMTGTALPDVDYTTMPPRSYGGTLTIPAGQDHAFLSIAAARDSVREPDETVEVTIQPSPDYEIAMDAGTTYQGDEGWVYHEQARGSVSVSFLDTTGPYTLTAASIVPAVHEGVEPPGIIRISRSGPGDLSDCVQFEFAVSGSADRDADIDPVRSSVLLQGWGCFRSGQRDFDIQVVPLDDCLQEGAETVSVQLLRADDDSFMLSGNPAEPSRATVTVFSDDTDPAVQLIQPAQDLNLRVGDRLDLQATATDADDGVNGVEFWLDRQMLGRVAAPYALSVVVPWCGPADDHVLRAKVIDNSGASVWSDSRHLFITPIPAGAGRGILREQWNNLAGGNLNALFADARYPQRPTETDDRWNYFCSDGYPDWGDAYAERLRGYFLAPATGDYQFLLQGNDYAELWLSSDDQPAHKRLLTSIYCTTNLEDSAVFPTQTTAAIRLEAGRRYYIEALHKEATGSDWLLVGVILPGGQRELPIPGNRLDPWVVQPSLELLPYGMGGNMGDIQVTEGASGTVYKAVLNSEPAADVEVWPTCDGQQIQTLPDHLVFPRATWWQPQRLLIAAVDDNHAEVSPAATTLLLNWSSGDEAYNDLPSVSLPVSVVDNDTNLPPQATRVWPKARKVYTTATNVQVIFEVQASDDGQPGPMTNSWSQRTGVNLQTGVVANTRTTNTLGVFSRTGAYEVVFTAAEAMAQTNLDFAVQTGCAMPVLKVVNFAPVVSAGTNLTILTNAMTTLKGTVTDDGLPANPGALTIKWEKLSGPGTVVFSNTATAATAFYAKTAGSYVLRLTAHDGEVKVCDDVAVTVKTSLGLLVK